VIAVDAGPMQIQWWKGAVWRRVETVLQGTRHDTLGAETGYGEKVSRRLWSQKLEEGIGLAIGNSDCAGSFEVAEIELLSSNMRYRSRLSIGISRFPLNLRSLLS
jgi:hypothetical protein